MTDNIIKELQAQEKAHEKSVARFTLSYEVIEGIANRFAKNPEKALRPIVLAAYRKDVAEKALKQVREEILVRQSQIAVIGCNYHG